MQIHSTEMQTRLITQLMTPIYTFFASDEFRCSLSSAENFIEFVGLNESPSSLSSSSSSTEAVSNRKKIFYFTNLYYGILKSISDTTTSTTDTTNMPPPPHLGFNLASFESLISLLKLFNLVHSSELRSRVNANILAMTDAAKATALGKEGSLNSTLSAAAATATAQQGIANMQSSDLNEPDKANMFFFNTYDTITQLLGLFLTKYKSELLFVPWSQNTFDMYSRMGESMFTCFEQLPTFRIRSMVRYVLKPCLQLPPTSSSSTLSTINRPLMSFIENNFCVVKANEMFLEYFLPNVFSFISRLNRVHADAQANNNNEHNEAEGNILNLNKYRKSPYLVPGTF